MSGGRWGRGWSWLSPGTGRFGAPVVVVPQGGCAVPGRLRFSPREPLLPRPECRPRTPGVIDLGLRSVGYLRTATPAPPTSRGREGRRGGVRWSVGTGAGAGSRGGQRGSAPPWSSSAGGCAVPGAFASAPTRAHSRPVPSAARGHQGVIDLGLRSVGYLRTATPAPPTSRGREGGGVVSGGRWGTGAGTGSRGGQGGSAPPWSSLAGVALCPGARASAPARATPSRRPQRRPRTRGP